MDIAYQANQHVAYMLRQWPQMDRQQALRDVRAGLAAGTVWLFPEPEQLGFEFEGEHAVASGHPAP